MEEMVWWVFLQDNDPKHGNLWLRDTSDLCNDSLLEDEQTQQGSNHFPGLWTENSQTQVCERS